MAKKKTTNADQNPSLLLSDDAPGLTPPHNIEIEQCLIGSLILDPGMLDNVLSIVHKDDFYLESHQILFDTIKTMFEVEHRLDVALMVDKLRTHSLLDKVGGEAYLVECLHSVSVAAHAPHYAEVVHEKSVLRTLIRTSTQILQDAYNSPMTANELINQAEERIFAIKGDGDRDDKIDISSIIRMTVEQISQQIQFGISSGILTGLYEFDKMTGGLHNGELIILAARPSMGKTALAANIADNACVVENKTVLFVSLEMAKIELAIRMICSRGEIDSRHFRSEGITDSDYSKLLRTVNVIKETKLFIDDSPVRTVSEIAALGRRLKRQDNLDMIIIDYLQLITPDNANDPRQEQVSKMTRRLKGIARELDIPIVCLSQLNRQAEQTKDNKPRMSHLRESGAIEQDADVIMFVHREEYYHSKEDLEKTENQGLKGKAEIIIAKQRNGPTGEVKLLWRPEYTKFCNLARDEDGTSISVEPNSDFTAFDGAV